MSTAVIYAIVNIVNDKYYVGQAVIKNKRWKNHRIALRTEKHYNKYLQASYNKYGAEAFIYVVLETIHEVTNKQSPEQVEARAAVHRGKIVSPETRAKMSASLKGRAISEETRIKMSIAALNRKDRA